MTGNLSSQAAFPDSGFSLQQELLSEVARTFALTTPQLPGRLKVLFGNVYLLCRINDTIEDDPGLSISQKDQFAKRFVDIVAGHDDESFGSELVDLLSDAVLAGEKKLIAKTAEVVGIKRQFSAVQQQILEHCVSTMSRGMMEFQRHASVDGLEDISAFNRYCYHVAGIVGETLTELMCDYSDEMRRHREALLSLSVSFGQGLQMINILKDVREDHARGVCWLPRDVFREAGVDLRNLHDARSGLGFATGILKLVALANHHLISARHYIQRVPSHETGCRKYCLWAAGMALATLRKINAKPDFKSGQDVKISKNAVRAIIAATSVFSRSDRFVDLFFHHLSRPLPSSMDENEFEHAIQSGPQQEHATGRTQ